MPLEDYAFIRTSPHTVSIRSPEEVSDIRYGEIRNMGGDWGVFIAGLNVGARSLDEAKARAATALDALRGALYA